MRPRGSAEVLAARRKAAGAMFEEGWNPAEVSQTLGVAYSAAWNWHKAWKDRGIAGLEPTPYPPKARRLTSRQLERLRKAILAGAMAAGFPDDTWTCPRVRSWIERTFGVTYHVDHLSKLLRAASHDSANSEAGGFRARSASGSGVPAENLETPQKGGGES